MGGLTQHGSSVSYALFLFLGEDMSVFMTNDKKELVVTCSCGCQCSFHIAIDDENKDSNYYAFVCFLAGSEYKDIEGCSPWLAFKRKMEKLWCVLRNKDYCYSDTFMSKEEFEEFKRYINQFD